MNLIVSRRFTLPREEEALRDSFYFNLWKNRLWPYKELGDGDTVFLYESTSGRFVWKARAVEVRRIEYESLKQAYKWLRSNYGPFDHEQDYLSEPQDGGYCLAFRCEPIELLDFPKPAGLRLPMSGWERDKEFLRKCGLPLDQQGNFEDKAMELSAAPVLSQEKLQEYQCIFLARMDPFTDFAQKGSFYRKNERDYKVELAERFVTSFQRSLFDLPPSEREAEVRSRLKALFTAKLTTIDAPQNLMGWRYHQPLLDLRGVQAGKFSEALANLLFADEAIAERIDKFVRSIWPIFSADSKANPYAQLRMVPTFFLMLMNPTEHITIRTDMFRAATKYLTGKNLLRSEGFSGAEYNDLLGFSRGVLGTLEQWGWCPNDMLDVHSFLWIVTRDSYGESDETNEGI